MCYLERYTHFNSFIIANICPQIYVDRNQKHNLTAKLNKLKKNLSVTISIRLHVPLSKFRHASLWQACHMWHLFIEDFLNIKKTINIVNMII